MGHHYRHTDKEFDDLERARGIARMTKAAFAEMARRDGYEPRYDGKRKQFFLHPVRAGVPPVEYKESGIVFTIEKWGGSYLSH
jgi:hypothetical protein